ncbi:MAG: reductive dehalogenase [Proteobacteria bacterium]|nr:reductive dehalogenase [Pseudomonadota bacterium]
METGADFKPFSQRNDMFMRAWWDETIHSKDTEQFFASYRMDASPRRGEGFNQRDFALRNASWTVADEYADRSQAQGKREGFSAPLKPRIEKYSEAVEFDSDVQATAEIKKIAKMFGADLVGIAKYDPRWTYSDVVDVRDMSTRPNEMPEVITHVIVLGHGMDYDLVKTYPSALAGTAVGAGYSKEAATAQQLSQYILNLGYEALASMNDTALVIPYAVQAGLGEYGRNQMVITPEFGPRVRFSKIFTNLPLKEDKPKQFGVRDFCDICTKCADACPVKALPFGPPSFERHNRSSIQGVKKWTADCEKCFGYWVKLNSDCAICMRVCPFNRDYSRPDSQLFLKLARGKWRRLALWWDRQTRNDRRLRPKDWWKALSRSPE